MSKRIIMITATEFREQFFKIIDSVYYHNELVYEVRKRGIIMGYFGMHYFKGPKTAFLKMIRTLDETYNELSTYDTE